MDWLTYVKDTINAGGIKKLKVNVPKVSKEVAIIREFHIRCVLSVGYMFAGDKRLTIENIKIDWVKSGPVADIR